LRLDTLCFSLSCGTTIYRSFSQELTSEDILTYYDLFEYKYCGKESEKENSRIMRRVLLLIIIDNLGWIADVRPGVIVLDMGIIIGRILLEGILSSLT